MKKIIKFLTSPIFLLSALIFLVYHEVFLFDKIAMPADTLVGSYFPWLDYKWGYSVGVPVKNPPISDIFSQFYIWKMKGVQSLIQGVVPLWNKFEFSGTPFLASYHTALLFPANLLLLIPKQWGWNLYISLSTLFAGLAMYLFLKRWIDNKWAALAGSIIFAFAGPMTTWAEFGTGVWAAIFIPLILYLVDVYILDSKKWALPAISISVALMFLAGHAQIDTYMAVIVPLYAFKRLNWNLRKSVKKLLNLFIAGLIGIGLSAIQLLPTTDFLNLSIRSQEQYASLFNYGLSPLTQSIRLWAADFFGHPSTYNHWGKVVYHEYSSFLGTLTLPVILALIISRSIGEKFKFFLYLFIATLLLAYQNPISLFIFKQPIPLLTYSSASRIFFITSFASAVLLSHGLDQFMKNKLSNLSLIFSATIFIILTGLALYFVPEQHMTISLRNSVIPLGLLIASAVSLKIIPSKQVLIILFVLLTSLDMGRYFRKYNPFVPARLTFPTTPVIEFLQEQPGTFRIARSNTNLLPPNTWEMYDLEAVEGYNPLRLLSYNRLFNIINDGEYASRPSRYAELSRHGSFNPVFLDALNVKYFVTLKRELVGVKDSNAKQIDKHEYEPVFEDKTVRIFQSPTYNSRAYFVPDYTVAKDKEHLAELIEAEDFDPRVAVILEEELEDEISAPDKTDKLGINYHSSNRVEIETVTSSSNLMVLADAYDPNWKVKIDGKESKIYKANIALRAVIVPAGKHNIVFEYYPDSYKLGARITLTSFALLAGITIFQFKKSKKQDQ